MPVFSSRSMLPLAEASVADEKAERLTRSLQAEVAFVGTSRLLYARGRDIHLSLPG